MLIADVKVPGHPVARKDFDYGYAITAHKSQGSTYQHVFVIESNMDRNRKTKERNQIKYVALSRPVHSATVLTDRDIESGNAYVDKPTPENDVVDPVNPDTTPTQGEIDNPSKGNVPPGGNLGDGNINDDVDVASGEIDDDVSGEVDDMFSIEPQEFVSDRELDEFIRKCKG